MLLPVERESLALDFCMHVWVFMFAIFLCNIKKRAKNEKKLSIKLGLILNSCGGTS